MDLDLDLSWETSNGSHPDASWPGRGEEASYPQSPPVPVQKRATQLRPADWEPHKARITDLYTHQKKGVSEIMRILEEETGFKATARQYEYRIGRWRLEKKVKPNEMRKIVEKRQQRNLVEPNRRELAFTVRGNVVDPEKITRWMKRNDIPESTLYAPSPAASTPSALDCWTISDLQSSDSMSVASTPRFAENGDTPDVESTPRASPAPSASYTTSSLPFLFLERSLDSTTEVEDVFIGYAVEIMKAARRIHLQQEERTLNHILSTIDSTEPPISRSFDRRRILHDLAEVYFHQEKIQDAEATIQKAMKVSESASTPYDGLLELYLLGKIYTRLGHWREAEPILREVAEFANIAFGESNRRTIDTLSTLHLIYQESELPEKEDEIRTRIVQLETELSESDESTYLRLYLSGHLCDPRGNTERTYRQVVQTYNEEQVEEVSQIATSLASLANVYMMSQQLEDEESRASRASSLCKKALDAEHSQSLYTTALHGAAIRRRRYVVGLAAKQLEEVIALRKEVLSNEHPDTLQNMRELASLLSKLFRLDDADKLFKQVLDTAEGTLGHQHPDAVESMRHLASILRASGQWEKAEQLDAEADQLSE